MTQRVMRLKVSPVPADSPDMRRPSLRRADGGIVLGWLLKVTLVLLIVGVIAYDVVSVAYSRVAASDDARYIALGASEAIVLQRADNAEAVQMAQERAESRGVPLKPKDITIDPDGTVTVHVSRTADTLVAYHFSALDRFTAIDETYRTPALK